MNNLKKMSFLDVIDSSNPNQREKSVRENAYLSIQDSISPGWRRLGASTAPKGTGSPIEGALVAGCTLYSSQPVAAPALHVDLARKLKTVCAISSYIQKVSAHKSPSLVACIESLSPPDVISSLLHPESTNCGWDDASFHSWSNQQPDPRLRHHKHLYCLDQSYA